MPTLSIPATSISSRPVRRRVSRFAAVALALATSLVASRAALAEGVLDKVPADAMVVIKVNNLAGTSAKIANLAEQLGLDMLQPKLADPLDSLKTELNITQGLNDAGELALVLLNPETHGGPDRSTLLLVPTSDYAALVANLQNARQDGKLTAFQGPGGSESFMADWGDGYAAIAENRDLLSAAPTETLRPSARAVQQMADNDLIVFANIPEIREPATEAIEAQREEQREEFINQMRRGQAAGQGANANAQQEQFAAVAGAGFDQMMNAAVAFLRDADAATIGLSFTETGIRQNVVADFRQDSYIGGLTTQMQGSNEPLVNGLPEGNYLFYMGMVHTPAVTNKFVDDVLGPIMLAVPADGDDAPRPAAGAAAAAAPANNEMREYLTGVKAFMAPVNQMSLGMATPQGQFGEEGIFQIIVNSQGNADEILSASREFSDKYAEITNNFMSASQGFRIDQVWTRDARKIGDVTFDVVATNVLGDNAVANQARQGMKFVYGSETPEALVGKVGNNSVLTLLNVPDNLITEAVAAARSNEAPLAALEHVNGVTTQLPGNRVVEGYIAVDQIATTMLRAANQFGFFQGNVQLPPDLPPVGIAISREGSSLQYSAFVSSDLMQAMISAGIQLSQRQQGGGRRGGGGLE